MKTVAPQINGVRAYFKGRIACSRSSDSGDGQGLLERGTEGSRNWPNFFKFQSMTIVTMPCNRRQETVSMPK